VQGENETEVCLSHPLSCAPLLRKPPTAMEIPV
jgi:hypothetical protein